MSDELSPHTYAKIAPAPFRPTGRSSPWRWHPEFVVRECHTSRGTKPTKRCLASAEAIGAAAMILHERGMLYREIGVIMGRPTATVSTAAARYRERLFAEDRAKGE